MSPLHTERPSPGSTPGGGRSPAPGGAPSRPGAFDPGRSPAPGETEAGPATGPVPGPLVGPVAVVTDGAAALPPAWRAEFEATGAFASVELPVLIGGQLHSEDEANTLSSLVIALAEGRSVTTSRPAPGQLRRTYAALQAAGFASIVSVHLSAELSGTMGAARIARQDIEIPVRLVDTRSAGLGQGLAVRAAVRAALAGQGLDDVAAAALAAASDAQLLIQVNSVDALRRGGRLLSGAVLNTVLPFKPLLSMQDGKIVTVERPVSQVKARARFMTLVGEALSHAQTDEPVLCIHHVADPHGARELGETLMDRYRPDAQLVLSDLPAALSAHVGLGAKVAVVEGPTGRPVAHGNRTAPGDA